MAIKVKLNDATVSLGGDFQAALSFVKSFPGRSFDGSTKTWTAPTDLKTFRQRSALPFDVLDAANPTVAGQHVTSYGTRYSSSEWAAKREISAIRPPDALIDEANAKRDAAEQALIEALRGLGMNDAAIAKLRGLEQRFAGDFGEAEEYGHIKFSSPERKAAVEAAFDAYWKAYSKADDAIDDFIAAEERRINDEYGIY